MKQNNTKTSSGKKGGSTAARPQTAAKPAKSPVKSGK
jgi:hypothetical protein